MGKVAQHLPRDPPSAKAGECYKFVTFPAINGLEEFPIFGEFLFCEATFENSPDDMRLHTF